LDLGLRGKSVLVTGGSRGIGRAAAEAFAAAGCALHLAARSADDLQGAADELRSSYQVSVTTHPGDLRNLGGVMTLAKACHDVDILVNNAGATPTGPIENVTDADWREGLDLKVIATVNLTRELYIAMRARRSGVIVNVIGNCGERPDPEIIIGTIANTGLMGFTRALGSVSPDYGVRVLGVNPGPTATERLVHLMQRKAEDRTGDPENWRELVKPLPFGRAAEPKEVAGRRAEGGRGYDCVCGIRPREFRVRHDPDCRWRRRLARQAVLSGAHGRNAQGGSRYRRHAYRPRDDRRGTRRDHGA
jgi:NAD(P)-dependent dehydrogenase (short-subunit alcohol dehydrogenase family)